MRKYADIPRRQHVCDRCGVLARYDESPHCRPRRYAVCQWTIRVSALPRSAYPMTGSHNFRVQFLLRVLADTMCNIHLTRYGTWFGSSWALWWLLYLSSMLASTSGFDILPPADYPRSPPKSYIKLPYPIVINLDLHPDRKVRLPPLGTWFAVDAVGNWQPGISTILQCLLPIRAMIFVSNSLSQTLLLIWALLLVTPLHLIAMSRPKQSGSPCQTGSSILVSEMVSRRLSSRGTLLCTEKKSSVQSTNGLG
jgi:hypothetical protein